MSDSEARNVLIIVLDTVRARSTSIGGRDITPTVDRVGDRGARFERAISPSPWSLPAHASMYTGKYPTEHGTTHHHQYLSDAQQTLAERLSEVGVTAGAFTANVFLTGTFNMDQGFNRISFVRGKQHQLFADALDPVQFLNERKYESGIGRFREIASEIADGPVLKNVANALYFKINDTLAGDEAEPTLAWDRETVAGARSFIKEMADREDRFFAMVNLIEAHAAWKYDREAVEAIGIDPEEIAPEQRWKEVAAKSRALWEYAAGEVSYDETDRQILTYLYESWVHNADALAGELLDTLDETGTREETLVVLTADHGESIATDGVHGHTVSVSEDIAHVPLVIDGPGIPDTTVSEAVSIKDIYGTVLDSAGIETDAPTVFDSTARGVALMETFGIDPDRIDDCFRETVGQFGLRRAIYTDDDRAERRYDNNEAFGTTDLLRRLDELIEAMEHVKYSEEGPTMDDEVEGRLRELGYLG